MSVLYVSKETLEQMKGELHRMRTVDRPAAARAIAEAREKGDLKENAEYDAAKENQGILEARIKSWKVIWLMHEFWKQKASIPARFRF